MSYDMIDRFLRNNLDDADYAEYSAALDALCGPQPHKPLTDEQSLILRKMIDHYGDDPRTECLRPLIGITGEPR